MKGVLFAISTVIVWATLNVVNRYCILKYDVDTIMFTAFMIFATGVSLLIIREKVDPDEWKKGIKYSWLYTTLQIIRSFFMISTFLYITSTETSLLFNIEVIITYIMAYAFFKRRPYKWDYFGILVILAGFILFIYALPKDIRLVVSMLILVAATASCMRSIVVEKTTVSNPKITVRQKCGISGYTLFIGGLVLIIFFFITAVIKHFIGTNPPEFLVTLKYLPSLQEVFHPATIISACIAGFSINALTTYLYYATLKFSTSETFMAVRVFQPILTYIFELIATIYLATMRPDLSVKDYILGGVIIVGSLLISIKPRKQETPAISKDFIAD